MRPCYGQGHDLTPEDPARVRGPEVGALMRHRSRYERYNNIVVRVLARSYVWSPELHNEDTGHHGYRRYDWSVIEYGPGRRLVVDDSDLSPIEPGDLLVAPQEA